MLDLNKWAASKKSLETKAKSLELTKAKKNKASGIIVNRSRNGYETTGNIRVVSIYSFKQLEFTNKIDYVTS